MIVINIKLYSWEQKIRKATLEILINIIIDYETDCTGDVDDILMY